MDQGACQHFFTTFAPRDDLRDAGPDGYPGHGRKTGHRLDQRGRPALGSNHSGKISGSQQKRFLTGEVLQRADQPLQPVNGCLHGQATPRR